MRSIYEKWMKKTLEVRNQNDIKENQKVDQKRNEKITIEAIENEFRYVSDFIKMEMEVNDERILIFYLESIIDASILQRHLLVPLHRITNDAILEVIPNAESIEWDQLSSLINDVINGNTIILLQNSRKIYKVDTYGPPERAISSSDTETNMLGPKDAFTESLQTNVSLIKRRIKSSKLKTKSSVIGKEARTNVSFMYLEDIANEENINQVEKRLNDIEIDGVLSTSILKQMIEDQPLSLFPVYLSTEKPDVAMSHLLDGRIAIMMDNSPEVIICPTTFVNMFNSTEDYYARWTVANMIRMIRFAGFFITILLTSTYVSVLTFHPEMLPPHLLNLLSQSRSQVPFPPVIEVLGIELVIEVLREAGARMPTKVGSTIGIVGGIVIGTAAVEAGLVSNILIVIVAVSALASFLPSSFEMSSAIRFIRYFFIVSAGFLGMYGQFLVLAWLLIHLTNMTSLGTPYFTPVIPRKWTDYLKDVFRLPYFLLNVRTGASRAKKFLTRPYGDD
ncbi:spore germination protein [Halalkalibacter flavus]|jgi:tetrahydromethanopterin S-methyltransferase subunit G|uniref:spore germination protein n=1 Tax=Halalkalibacter flavus TaxID=3090668 RepID=UPI002FCA1B0B